MMGGANSKLTYSPSGFTVYMMVISRVLVRQQPAEKLAALRLKAEIERSLDAMHVDRIDWRL